ncbi:hypothetical protein F3Y22_tig00111429pilonHSYRG00005 [Hibiscus syriacus]|uniref:SWIM-type domain-containing protein n=1 Tax=Hibiscus syriacus TaxID=106335 RepID=A0A6A2XRK8_HIBSY|nr:hypothetical protein F3Y22_tig00111429pilonHSYRG00005 [Hibiscus syriacus]
MPVTRTRCKARVVVIATNTNDQWVISKSYQEHNHALCTPAMTQFMCSNRAAIKADIDEATTLKEVGVGTSQVMNYLTQQAGGYHNVGFTHKDLYNALQRGKSKEIVDGDVNALIAYFDYKKHDDPEFFMTYSVDKSGALYNLIWSDSTSRSNYTCFGDVITFDTTYKNNLYGQPIMPIVGVNHHHNTIVFATAIIVDETSQSFEWVLQNFLEAMMNKSPISVVTDGDRQHSQNAWLLGGQPRNLIFNGVRLFHNSTSKSIHGCESMNASLAIALKRKKTYLDVVRAIEDGISRMRMNELKVDYLSSHTKPFQITKLFYLESYAAEIFTCESFRAFQDELLRETLYQIEAEIQSLSDECYILSKYKEKKRKFEISFDSRTKTLICSCKIFETVGLPCRHQLHILKHLDYTYLPGTLIQSRWTNDAKASAPSYVDLNVSPEVMQMTRFAALCSTSSRLCYIASKTDESFKTARDEIKRLIEELENSFGLNDSVNQSIVVNNVHGPQRKQRKRKEVPKNKVEKIIRRCGYCNGEGHNKIACPQGKLSLSIMGESVPPMGESVPSEHSGNLGVKPFRGNRYPLWKGVGSL